MEEPKTAYVTGGGSGIGLAVAEALLDAGWRVAICGRDEEKLEAAASRLGRPDRLLATKADVSQSADVERWVADAAQRLGAPALLVLNAGVASEGEIAILSEHQWNETLAVNLTGPFLVTRSVLPLMRPSGGYVVALSSLAGKHGMRGVGAYSASKFGLIGLAETLQKEEAPYGIRVTTICPGFVATAMVAGASTPAEEMIQPEDIAKTIMWLLDLSPHVVIREVLVERTGSL